MDAFDSTLENVRIRLDAIMRRIQARTLSGGGSSKIDALISLLALAKFAVSNCSARPRQNRHNFIYASDLLYVADCLAARRSFYKKKRYDFAGELIELEPCIRAVVWHLYAAVHYRLPSAPDFPVPKMNKMFLFAIFVIVFVLVELALNACDTFFASIASN